MWIHYRKVHDGHDGPGKYKVSSISGFSGSDVTHTFTSDGHFSVSVNCSNDVSQNVFDFIQKVEYAIVGRYMSTTSYNMALISVAQWWHIQMPYFLL